MFVMTNTTTKSRRGRPPKAAGSSRDTRAELIRSGLAHLTENGFAASGIDTILKKAGVPKGSFSFYFASKEAFGHAVLNSYAEYFAGKLKNALTNTNLPALERIAAFVDSAKEGMAKHDFKRGCLVGNLGQEVDGLPESFRSRLIDIFQSWQDQLAVCLEEAKVSGDIPATTNCAATAEYFWTGWEGAVSRAKLERSARPLDNYLTCFMNGLR